jgi:hypothetical protein
VATVRWFDLLCGLTWLALGALLLLLWSRGGPLPALYFGAALVFVAAAGALLTRGWRDYGDVRAGWQKALVRLPKWSLLTVLVIVTSITTCSLPS